MTKISTFQTDSNLIKSVEEVSLCGRCAINFLTSNPPAVLRDTSNALVHILRKAVEDYVMNETRIHVRR